MTAGGGGERSRGELDPDPLPLRPRGPTELVDASVELLRGRFPLYFGLAALILAPVRVAGYFSAHSWAEAEGAEALLLLRFILLNVLLPAFVPAVITALVIVIVHGQLLGRNIAPGAAAHTALRRLPALLALLIVMALITALVVVVPILLTAVVPFCLPLVPLSFGAVVWLYFKLYLATPALMLESLGPVAAMRRSFELTAGGFLRWLGTVVLAGLLAALVSGLAQVGDDTWVRDEVLGATGLSHAMFALLYLPISTILTAIPTAFVAVVATAFYLDARMRREGFDLVLRLERATQVGAS